MTDQNGYVDFSTSPSQNANETAGDHAAGYIDFTTPLPSTVGQVNAVAAAAGLPIGSDVNANASGKTKPTKAIYGSIAAAVAGGATAFGTQIAAGADFAQWQTYIPIVVAIAAGFGITFPSVYLPVNHAKTSK